MAHPPPIRPALQATSREQASAITHATAGRKVSDQAWAIYAKIRDVDDELRKLPEPQRV